MKKRVGFKIVLPGLIAFVSAIFFCGLADSRPLIVADNGEKLFFTDTRPDINDTTIVACFPAAYSDGKGIVGHYSTGNGRRGVSDYRYTTIHLSDHTYFQQATLVRNHVAKSFSDSRLRYRRVLCVKNGVYSVVHSKVPVTLTAFARQLTNYDNVWNLDMGTYAFGWYRDCGQIHYLGLSTFLNRDKQTNWIVIKK